MDLDRAAAPLYVRGRRDAWPCFPTWVGLADGLGWGVTR